jgi:micrococcal nuclease
MSLPIRCAVLAALVLALASGAASAGTGGGGVGYRTTATIARIVDGDTLVLRTGSRVRLLQIDSPEAGGECYADAATRELRRLAPPGTRVELETDQRLDRIDRYGRLLRYVHAGRTNVNVELVRRGAATPWFYGGERGRYARKLLSAVAAARAAARGMWRACRVVWSPDEAVETHRR